MPELTFGKGRKRQQREGGARGFFRMVNIPLLAVVVVLVAVGLSTLHVVTLTDADYSFNRQLLGIGLGVVAMVAFWLFNYHYFQRLTIVLLVIDIVLILLPMVPGLGVEVNGATSWIRIGPLSYQPSELAKPVTIVMFASYVSRFEGNIVRGRDLAKCLALVIVPIVLLAREDLGTSLVVLIICAVILFVGGLARRWLLTMVVVGAVGVAVLLAGNSFISDWTGGEVKLIKDYQMSRLLVFIDQDNADYADDAYNLNQAKIAVGSGEVTGKGYGNATQSSGGFLPESATDFIFCVYAEMHGFLGDVVLLVLYLALLAAALAIGIRAGDLCGTLVAGGIMGMWMFQVLENIGMDIGLMPITGIPLPFMSYGSSFMITNFICVGLLLSVWANRDGAPAGSSKAAKVEI